MDSYRRVNAASVGNVVLLTWCLLQDNCKRIVRNRTLTSNRLMLIWIRHLTRSAETAFGESWQNTGTPKNTSPSLDNFMTACIQECKTTEKGPVTNGIEQGCVLAPTTFSIMFSAILLDAFNSSDNGIDIRYHTDCSEGFNQKQGKNWYHQRVDVRRRLCTERYYQSQHAKQSWQVLNGLWQFWFDHQYKKERSDS